MDTRSIDCRTLLVVSAVEGAIGLDGAEIKYRRQPSKHYQGIKDVPQDLRYSRRRGFIRRSEECSTRITRPSCLELWGMSIAVQGASKAENDCSDDRSGPASDPRQRMKEFEQGYAPDRGKRTNAGGPDRALVRKPAW